MNHFVELTPESHHKDAGSTEEQSGSGIGIALKEANGFLVFIDEHSLYHHQVVVQ